MTRLSAPNPANIAAADQALQQALGYQFVDADLYVQALSHRSTGPGNYERLEFLGDGLLNLVVARALFDRKPDAPEGDLSRLRATLVRESTLADVAKTIGVIPAMRLGGGERASAGHRRASIQADMVEALLGAIYLEAGFAAARDCVLRLWADHLAKLPDAASLKDPKTRLQELLQTDGGALPTYGIEQIVGPTHQQQFTCSCQLEDGRVFHGTGTSRRKAEQAAAQCAVAAVEADAAQQRAS